MPTTRFDRPLCRQIATDIEAALKPVLEKHGLTGSYTGGRFTETTFTPKLTLSVTNASGAPADFASHARMLGLPEDCYGKEFVANGERFRITGLTMRRPRFPVTGQRVKDNKGFKFPVSSVQLGLRATV